MTDKRTSYVNVPINVTVLEYKVIWEPFENTVLAGSNAGSVMINPYLSGRGGWQCLNALLGLDFL